MQSVSLLRWQRHGVLAQDGGCVESSEHAIPSPAQSLLRKACPTDLRRKYVRLKLVGRVAQLVEQRPFKAWVAGSIPAALTKISKYLEDFGRVDFGHPRTPRASETLVSTPLR